MWPSKGKRNKPEIPDGIHLVYRPKGSWYDIEVMKNTIRYILSPISR